MQSKHDYYYFIVWVILFSVVMAATLATDLTVYLFLLNYLAQSKKGQSERRILAVTSDLPVDRRYTEVLRMNRVALFNPG